MGYELLALVAEFFPDFDRWLRQSSRRSKFMETAEEALRAASRDSLAEACRRLLHGETVRAQRLPFVIAEMAKQMDTRRAAVKWSRIAEGDTFGCRLCHDTGFVEILHPETVQTLQETGKWTFPYTSVVLCNCPAGDRRVQVSAALKLRRLRSGDIKRDDRMSPREQYMTLFAPRN